MVLQVNSVFKIVSSFYLGFSRAR